MTDREKELIKENEMLKELLKETLHAMCEFRSEKGHCTSCNSQVFCSSRKVIPKVEKVLNIKHDLNKK